MAWAAWSQRIAEETVTKASQLMPYSSLFALSRGSMIDSEGITNKDRREEFI
jgi:hypothetical protein